MFSTITYPSQSEVRSIFNYKQGHLWWNHPRKGRQINKPAGNIDRSHGYRSIGLDGQKYQANRLTWIYHYGSIPFDVLVDHINGVRHDNRIENLRLADPSSNAANKATTDNLYGRGVVMVKDRYVARIYKNHKPMQIGTYDSPEQAHAAYQAASLKMHGEFSIYNRPSCVGFS